MRSQSSISLAVEQLEDRFVLSSVKGVAGSIGLAVGLAPGALVSTQAPASASTNGAAGQMPAFYEGTQVTVNMKELPDNGSASISAPSNRSAALALPGTREISGVRSSSFRPAATARLGPRCSTARAAGRPPRWKPIP